MWMRESGVNLGTIGLFALVGTPYTIKFLWAPVIDALNVPLLSSALGRRRGWLVFSQLLLIAAILILALTDPAKSPFYVALGALLVATASATQDTVVDAFRVESLPEDEQAAGMAAYVAAYRVGTSGFDRRTPCFSSPISKPRTRKIDCLDLVLRGDGGDDRRRHGRLYSGHRAGALVVKASDWDNYHPQFETIRLRYDWLTKRCMRRSGN